MENKNFCGEDMKSIYAYIIKNSNIENLLLILKNIEIFTPKNVLSRSLYGYQFLLV